MCWTFRSIRQLGFALVLLTLEVNVFACHCMYAFPTHQHQASPVDTGRHALTHHHDHTTGSCIHTFAVQQSCELQSSLPETTRSFYVGLEVALPQNANADPLFSQSSYAPPPLSVVALRHPAAPDIPPERL